MTLGDIIKAYRTEHNLSMDAFSEKSGISKAYISLLEKNKHPKTGKSIAPSIQCIKQAAMGMDIDFNNLFNMLDGDVSLGNELSNNHTSSYSKKSVFASRIMQIRKENGYQTRKSFAIEFGIPETTLRNYEKNEREPNFDFLIKFSETFNISTDYLLGLTDDKEVLHTFRLRSSEQSIIKKYRNLDTLGQEHVQTVLEWESKRIAMLEDQKELFEHSDISNFQTQSSGQRTRTLHYYQRLASAGTGQFIFDDVPVDLIEIPDIPEYKKVKYAIGVNGRSMEPLYYDGDILLVEPCKEINIGEIGIFIVDGDSFVKKLGKDILISVNEDYSDIPITEETHCLGLVVDKISPTLEIQENFNN